MITRIDQCSLRFQPVDQLDEGIEANDVQPVSDEVRERIYVVVEALPVAIVGNVLDAAKLDAGMAHHAFYIFDHIRRGLISFDADAGLRSIYRACRAIQIYSRCRLADVRRAKIEGLAGNVNFDRIEKLPVENLNANNMRTACRDELLHQRRRIEAQAQFAGVRSRREGFRSVKALHARAGT